MQVWIGLGANLQQPISQLKQALLRIGQVSGIDIVATSSFYRTPPWGDTDQDEFINAVILVDTRFQPEELLRQLQAIETSMGRVRKNRRWGPRLIDIDILMFGQQQIESLDLIVPHLHMHERAFVLLPLLELDPNIEIPGKGRADEMLSDLEVGAIEKLVGLGAG